MYTLYIIIGRLSGVPGYFDTYLAYVPQTDENLKLDKNCQKVIRFEKEYGMNKNHGNNKYFNSRIKCLEWLTSNNTKTVYPESSSLAAQINDLYSQLYKLDVFVGMIASKPLNPDESDEGVLSVYSTIAQFNRFRNADRFWFERDGILTQSELDYVLNRNFIDLLKEHFNFKDDINEPFFKYNDYDLRLANQC